MHGIEKRYVFLFSAPQVSAWGALLSQCWLVSSWLEWWLPLVEVFGGASRSTASTGGFLPDSRALGAGLPGLLGSFSWSYCLRHVQVVAATAAPPVLHTLRQPGFPRILRLRGCRRWLRLRILSGAFTFGSFSARYPARRRLLLLVASWYGG